MHPLSHSTLCLFLCSRLFTTRVLNVTANATLCTISTKLWTSITSQMEGSTCELNDCLVTKQGIFRKLRITKEGALWSFINFTFLHSSDHNRSVKMLNNIPLYIYIYIYISYNTPYGILRVFYHMNKLGRIIRLQNLPFLPFFAVFGLC